MVQPKTGPKYILEDPPGKSRSLRRSPNSTFYVTWTNVTKLKKSYTKKLTVSYVARACVSDLSIFPRVSKTFHYFLCVPLCLEHLLLMSLRRTFPFSLFANSTPHGKDAELGTPLREDLQYLGTTSARRMEAPKLPYFLPKPKRQGRRLKRR